MAARRQLGFVIADIGQQQRVPYRHAAGLFDELDKLLDTQRFLISGASKRAAGKPFGAVSDRTGPSGWAPEADGAPKMAAAESTSPVKKRAQVVVKVASAHEVSAKH